jgi:hypothetical protein
MTARRRALQKPRLRPKCAVDFAFLLHCLNLLKAQGLPGDVEARAAALYTSAHEDLWKCVARRSSLVQPSSSTHAGLRCLKMPSKPAMQSWSGD